MKSIGCLFDSVLSQVPVPWALSFFRLQIRFAKLCPIVSDIGQLTKSRPHRECRGFATSVSFVRAVDGHLMACHLLLPLAELPVVDELASASISNGCLLDSGISKVPCENMHQTSSTYCT